VTAVGLALAAAEVEGVVSDIWVFWHERGYSACFQNKKLVKRSTNCSQSTVIAAAEAIQSLFQLRDATGA
jgi:hypothetical protein